MVAGEVLVLWDVDHTLINAGGLSTHLYGIVFAELFGRELPQVAPMAGRTDRAIIVETLTQAGIADPRSHVPAFIAELTRQAPAFGERVRGRGRVLPGVPEALAMLAGGSGVVGGSGARGIFIAAVSPADPFQLASIPPTLRRRSSFCLSIRRSPAALYVYSRHRAN